MSFKCQNCGKPQSNRVKPVKVTTDTRVVMHTQVKVDYEGNRNRYETCGGPQIVSEVDLCGQCALMEKFGGEG